MGGNIENTAFNQEDRFKDNSRKYSYNNFYPQSYFSYKFNSFSNIRINYNGRTTQPTINQLQPLLNNEDPLNVVIGNPNLKQSFTNTVSLNYSSFQMINERSIFLGANYNATEDQISNSYVIDSLGKRVNQYINVDGNYSVSTYGGFNMKIPKTNLGIGFSPSLYLSKSTNYINKIRNTNNNLTFSPTIRITNRKPDVYELYFSATPGYTRSKSSISKAASTNYWTYSFSVEGNVVLPGKIEIGSDVDFQFREKLDALDNQNNVILWNAYLEKKFLKNDVLTLRASVNDILDQNKGYSRTVQPDATVERTYLLSSAMD